MTTADPRMKGLDLDHPGAKLIAKTTCLACHMTEQKSHGPIYKDVATKYRNDPLATLQQVSKHGLFLLLADFTLFASSTADSLEHLQGL